MQALGNKKTNFIARILSLMPLKILIICFILFAIFPILKEETTYNNAISQTIGVVANTRSYFATFGSYKGLTNSVAIKANIFPESMIISIPGNKMIKNTWNGSIILSESSSGDSFSKTITRVPQKACKRLISEKIIGGNILYISVNGITQTLPLSPLTAEEACNVASNMGNTIRWEIQ